MMPSRTPRVPSIGFCSCQRFAASKRRSSSAVSPPVRRLQGEVRDVGQELVQRRVEQAHGDGQAVHRLQDLGEVGPLGPAQLVERGGLLRVSRGEDHAPHDRQPLVAEEHVLGAA